MRVLEAHISAPDDRFTRLSATVEYANGEHDVYWFDVPVALPPSRSGNPWLACLLPLAATLHEDLEIPFPVDPDLLENATGLLRLWQSWYPHVGHVSVFAEAGTIPDAGADAMSFFSAGVDSFFTAVRRPVQAFVNVLGFDMPLSNEAAFIAHGERLTVIADELGADLISVRTNIRQTRWRECHWELLGFGAALAAVGLLLERRFATVYIPSSVDFGNLFAWGSHPLSDPLFSTSTTRLIHDGSSATRVEKIVAIAERPLVQRTLHVCFRGRDGEGQDDTNCCQCEKCFRTMAVLDTMGVLEQFKLFDHSRFNCDALSRALLDTRADRVFYQEIRDYASKHGRADIVVAIDRAIRRTSQLEHWRFLQKAPGLWRIANALERRARASSLR